MSNRLHEEVASVLTSIEHKIICANGEVSVEVATSDILQTLELLRTAPTTHFDMLIDLCGIDYGAYGNAEWQTESATSEGFSRARAPQMPWDASNTKLAVVYHLMSTILNHRVRVRCYCDAEAPIVPSASEQWPCANWFEREAYDLYGILFEGHPDLRRILTDYGFVGHPFRKDFPVSGYVEMRYDHETQRCVYEPVDIEPRILVPKVVRDDNRYAHEEHKD